MPVDLPRWPGELAAVFMDPCVNRGVSGLHAIVSAHIDRGRYRAPESDRVTATLNLNTARDHKFTRDVGMVVKHYIQASLAFETRVELVKQFSDSRLGIRSRRTTAHHGDRLFRNVLYFDGP